MPEATPTATTMERSSPEAREQLLVQIDPAVKLAIKVAAVKRGEPLWFVVEQAARRWLSEEGQGE